MDGEAELDDLRADIDVLRGLIDVALDRRVPFDDVMLRALVGTLQERTRRLEELEQAGCLRNR